MPRLPSPRRLALPIVLSLVLFAGAGIWLRLRSLDGALHDGWKRSLEGGALTTQETVDEWHGERVADARELASSIAIHSTGSKRPEDRAAFIHALIGPINRHGKFAGIWVVDAQSRVIAGSTADTLQPEEIAAALEAVHSDSTTHSALIPRGHHAAWLTFASPVARTRESSSGSELAAVVMRTDVVQAFRPWAAGRPNAAMSLFSSTSPRGVVLIEACPAEETPVCISTRDSLRAGSPAALALARRDSFGGFTSFDGQQVLAATRYDRTLGWGVVRRIRLSDALVPLRREQAVEGAFLLVLVALAGVGAFAWNRMVRVKHLFEQRLSHERLATVIDASSDGLLSLDGRYDITMVNSAVERLLGYPRDQLIGRSVLSLFATSQLAELKHALDEFASSGLQQAPLPALAGSAARTSDGRLVPVESHVGRALSGVDALFVIGMRDVAERVRAERFVDGQRQVLELMASGADVSASLSMLLELLEAEAPAMRCAVYDVDDDHRIARLLSGPSLSPGLRSEIEAVVVGATIDAIGSAVHLNSTVVAPNIGSDPRFEGSRHRLLAHGVQGAAAIPLRSVDGDVIGVLAWFYESPREPSEREMELARAAVHLASIALSSARDASSLRASEASFRSFVENAPAAVFRETRDGRIVSTNRAMVNLLGDADADSLSMRLRIEPLYDNSAARGALLLSLEADGLVRGAEVEWRKADGSLVTVRINARAYRDDHGAVWLWEGFAEDVTPLRAAEQALRRSERLAAVGHLISGVAHELNNPLASILHFAEDLLEDPRSPEDAEALGVIRDQARRSRAIVRDLLSFVRKREVNAEPLLLAEVVESTTRAMRRTLESSGTRLHFENADSEVIILADRAGVAQIVTNLVSNAAHAAGPGGDVWVTTCSVPAGCRLTVEDSGHGIAPEVMPRIFDPFFTTKKTGDGTGLGLSVTLGIVEQFGGRIAVEARDGGPGSRFTVSFPCADAEAVRAYRACSVPLPTAATEGTPVAAPAAPAPSAAQASPGRLALIIDDEPTIRGALRRYFVRRGWRVEEAPDGAVGLALLEQFGAEVGIVVSDLRMPGFSGIELHDRLMIEHPELLERVVFSTGDVASSEAASFVQRTHCYVLQKPFELRMLDDIIVRLDEGRARERVVV